MRDKTQKERDTHTHREQPHDTLWWATSRHTMVGNLVDTIVDTIVNTTVDTIVHTIMECGPVDRTH